MSDANGPAAMPGEREPARWAFLDHPHPIAYAHRGGSAENPENTMRAFAAAVDLGYRYLETDVRLTADGVLVAFHDHTLERVTDRTGAISRLRWAEVQEIRIAGEPIPRLEEILGTWPEVRVNIDPKHDAAVAPLVEALERTKALDRVCVTAFSDRRMASFRRLSGGRTCTATSPGEITRLRLASFTMTRHPVKAACIQAPVRVANRLLIDRRFVDNAHRLNLPVHAWTIDDAAQMGALLDLGVDGIMSDRPSVLKEVLVARGAWA